MKLFTRDADAKMDTPLSIWVGLLFIGIAILFKATRIGPGEFTSLWSMSLHMFFILTGLSVLIPGLLLTLARPPS